MKKLNDTQQKIVLVCDNIKHFLLEKNKRYGDSAINPIKVFTSLDVNDLINVRCNDKIMRIINSSEEQKNDFVDLIGYLILKCVLKDWLDFTELID